MRIKLIILLMLLPLSVTFGQNHRIASTPKVNYDWQPGFVSITELTGAPGLGVTDNELSKYYYGITTMAAYQFTRNIRTGLGAGVHFHNGGTLFPLFLEMKYSVSSQVIVPFIAGTGGVEIDAGDLGNSRVFINPSAGVRYVAAKRTCLTFSTGLMVSTGGPSERKSFLNFKFGIELKPKKTR